MSAKNNFIEKMEEINRIFRSIENLRIVLLDLKDDADPQIRKKAEYLNRIFGYSFAYDHRSDLLFKIREDILNE